jgi:signal recognition particle subunit SRP54
MGSLKDLLEKFPIFGDQTAQLNIDDRELTKIEAMYQSMTKQERKDPNIFNESRINRVAKGSGTPPKAVKDLLDRYGMMRQVMGSIGQSPGLLGNLPGFKQLKQLNSMKNMDMSALMSQMGGMDPMAAMGQLNQMGMGMQMPKQMVGRGMEAGMPAHMLAKMRREGYTTGPAAVEEMSEAKKKELKDKKKRERQNKKKNRKK